MTARFVSYPPRTFQILRQECSFNSRAVLQQHGPARSSPPQSRRLFCPRAMEDGKASAEAAHVAASSQEVGRDALASPNKQSVMTASVQQPPVRPTVTSRVNGLHSTSALFLAMLSAGLLGAAAYLWRTTSRVLKDPSLQHIRNADAYVQAVKAKLGVGTHSHTASADALRLAEEAEQLANTKLDDLKRAPWRLHNVTTTDAVSGAVPTSRGVIHGPPVPPRVDTLPNARKPGGYTSRVDSMSATPGHFPGIAVMEPEKDVGTASWPAAPRWWELSTVSVIIAVSALEGVVEVPVCIHFPDGSVVVPAIQDQTSGEVFASALANWLEHSASTRAALQLDGRDLEVREIFPSEVDKRNVPDIFLLSERLIQSSQETGFFEWRRAAGVEASAQLAAWQRHLAEVSPSNSLRARAAAGRSGADTATEIAKPRVFGSPDEMPDDGVGAADLRLLTEEQSRGDLVEGNIDMLPVLYVPFVGRPGAGSDRSVLTVDVSIGEEQHDVVAVAFADATDAKALLAMLAHAPGYTDHDTMERRVVPMAGGTARAAAAQQGATLLCFRPGFRKAAGMRAGANMSDVISTMAGARWAASVAEQLSAAQ